VLDTRASAHAISGQAEFLTQLKVGIPISGFFWPENEASVGTRKIRNILRWPNGLQFAPLDFSGHHSRD
jgi:hypothetical protein